MTTPGPFDTAQNYDEARKTWLQRYLRIQGATDTRIRTILIEGADSAESALSALNSNPNFSAGVRSAQLRLVMREIRGVLNDLFGELKPVISDGQGKSAVGAVDAFAKTDREYLVAAFRNSAGSLREIDNFIDGQRTSAQLGVANAISRIQHSDKPLSERVYRTRFLATRWVQNTVTSHVMRGSSAIDIAKDVRRSIRPNTPGGVSYAALRLGRTELNNAFHATSVELAKDRPWVEGMRWNLSQVHEIDPANPEICEQYHTRIFPVDQVPGKPHPQCRCFVTPELEAFDSFLRNLTSGQYRSWISNAA